MNDRSSPYNPAEIRSAKITLTRELERDSYRFLRNGIFGLADSHSSYPDNLWEGPTGFMDHIESSFPMPPRMKPKSESSSTTSNCDIASPSATSVSSSSKDSKVDVSNSPIFKDECDKETGSSETKIQISISSQSPSLTSQSNNTDTEVNENSILSVSSSDDDDDPKALIETKDSICDESPSTKGSKKDIDYVVHSKTDTGNNNSCVNVSKLEKQHWTRLSNLQKKINLARRDLVALKSSFRKSRNEIACKQMESLHWTIHSLITALNEEKVLGEKHNLRLFINKNQFDFKGSHASRLMPHCYSETWNSLKKLWSKFKCVWKTNGSALSEFNSLDLDKMNIFSLKSRLHKIMVKKNTDSEVIEVL